MRPNDRASAWIAGVTRIMRRSEETPLRKERAAAPQINSASNRATAVFR